MSIPGYQNVIANQPVVIDNGSGMMKAGFAGEEKPTLFFPSYVARPKHRRVMAGALEGDKFVGNKVDQLRGLMSINYPLANGIVHDWNDLETIWTYIYQEMKINTEDHPVLLTEAPLNPKRNREAAAELFFETFNSPALYICIQAILCLYSSGKTTGIVLDVGDGVAHTVPVFEGFAIQHAVSRSECAGRNITEYLALQLRRSGYSFHTSAEMEVVKTIKEKTCYINFHTYKDQQDAKFASPNTFYPYTLPDGSEIKLGAERFKAPELLFQPNLMGMEYMGVDDLVLTSIAKSDLDIRKILFNQMVLSGGSTMFQGFGDRLLNETRKMAPKDAKVRIIAPTERQLTTWIGGSILASLTCFNKLWVSKQEYEEQGFVALHRKSL